MGMFFNNNEAACTYLYVNGWRQNEAGEWIKGKKKASIRMSPAKDGVVCVFIR
jgi:hypothetical protein